MNGIWEMYLLEYAHSHEPWVGLVSGMHGEGMVDLPYSFILLRQGGRNVLVDCGFMQTGERDAFPLKFSVSNWLSPLRLLSVLGVEPASVSDIVTHAHFDHIGAIGEFPAARLHLQKNELLFWQEAMTLPHRFSYLTRIVEPATLRVLRAASNEHRLALLDGDGDNVLPGVHVRLASGHTPGHQCVMVETARGRRIISGDCLYSRRQLTGLANDGVYAPLANATGTLLEQLRTLDRLHEAIEGEHERLVVMHDVERWTGTPCVAEIEGHRIVRVA